MPDDKPLHRRDFFRRGLRELLKPLAQSLEPVERTINQLDKLQSQKPKTQPLPVVHWLRPPGALREPDFLSTCSRCGECVRVCPAEALKIDPRQEQGGGFPHIDANSAACVACDGLHCMQECPTGALVPTPLTQIKMGTAVWREDRCVRIRGEECTKCLDICPLGTAAIDLEGNDIQVKPLACIGCGLCQLHCPTYPKSITVIPVAARNV